MRIVSRKVFLELPTGTVYSKYEGSGNVEGLFTKGDTTESGNDFLYDSLLDETLTNSSGERFDLFERAEMDSNFKFELDLNYTGRDGLFSDDQLYMVYDNTDVLNLIQKLQLSVDPGK